jgi:hypothetical protein
MQPSDDKPVVGRFGTGPLLEYTDAGDASDSKSGSNVRSNLDTKVKTKGKALGPWGQRPGIVPEEITDPLERLRQGYQQLMDIANRVEDTPKDARVLLANIQKCDDIFGQPVREVVQRIMGDSLISKCYTDQLLGFVTDNLTLIRLEASKRVKRVSEMCCRCSCQWVPSLFCFRVVAFVFVVLPLPGFGLVSVRLRAGIGWALGWGRLVRLCLRSHAVVFILCVWLAGFFTRDGP